MMIVAGALSQRRQRGQAIVLGLMFLAVVVLAMLVLYNRGMLIKNRVQLENAADAAAYSQAKLQARNMNFAAYTNRAMVANEVSIGQMVSLLSWAKHYRNMGAFTRAPVYQFPIAPPSPVTFSQVLGVVTLPYRIMGGIVSVAAKPMVRVWPQAMSYFNTALGVFQQLFALSTLTAQMEMNTEIIDAHQFEDGEQGFYTPFIGWYFMAQNATLTYAGRKFNIPGLSGALSGVTIAGNEDGVIADFLGGQTTTLHNLINRNSPNRRVQPDPNGDNPIALAYQRYAAIVNKNRDDFTRDRHWDIWASTPDIFPELSLDFGIVKLTIDLDFQVGFGIKNDGGAVYAGIRGQMDTLRQVKQLGWSAIDVMSMGVEFDIGIYVSIEICLPVVGCNGGTLLDLNFTLGLGLPLAGATHQLVSSPAYAKRTLPQWLKMAGAKRVKKFSSILADTPYGGDPNDPVNDGPLSPFHAVTLIWGQAAMGGMYGTRPGMDVTNSYGGPPAFLSLGRNFQESRVSYEYVTAVAKSLDDIQTSDNKSGMNIGNSDAADPYDWDGEDIALYRLEVDSKSRAEADDSAAAYQQAIWDDSRAMMTISAAEAYFKNPMQFTEPGVEEPASLFSPFWDARLKEPSAISLLIASGEVDWEKLFDNMPSNAVDMINWLLTTTAASTVQTSIDYAATMVMPPLDTLVIPILDKAGAAATEAVNGAIDDMTQQLEPYVE